MPAPVEPLLALWLLTGPLPAAPQAEAPLPDAAMLEFLAAFASEDGQLTDPETIEQIKLKEDQTPADADHSRADEKHKPGARQP